MRATLAFAAAASAVLAACAAPPKEMNRAEYLAATSRVYAQATPEQVIEAATAVLSLADEVEFRFAHNADGFQATKLSAGSTPTEYWELRAVTTPQGVRAAVQVNSTSIMLMPVPITGGNVGLSSSMNGAVMVPGNAVYDLFWARIDYMLHKRDSWTTCEDQGERVSKGAVEGPIDPLCRTGMDDNRPGQPKAFRAHGAPARSVERAFRTGELAPDRKPL